METPRQSLINRLKLSLDAHTDQPLITDSQEGNWSGGDILACCHAIETSLNRLSPPGAFIGISFPEGAVQGIAIIATLVSGRIPVILNQIDMLNDQDTWIARSQCSTFLSSEVEMQLTVNSIQLDEQGQVATVSGDMVDTVIPARTDEIAHVIFTSGSTGNPRGVLVPSLGLLKTSDFLTDYFGLIEQTSAAIVLPIFHSMALNTQFIPTLLAGGRCDFMNSRLSLSRIYRRILARESSFLAMIGEVLTLCWEEKERRKLEPATSVTDIQLAGGLITSKHLEMASALFPNATLHKGYGLTEAIRVTMIPSSDERFYSSSVGAPLPFVDVQIRDDAGLTISTDEIGEIFVKGPNVYVGSTGPGLYPVGEDGYLPTGDFGQWTDNGHLVIKGRKDSVMKVNGHRISGFELEKLAMDAHDLIKGAKAIVVENERLHSSKMILFLELSTGPSGAVTDAELTDLEANLWARSQRLSFFPKEVAVLQQFPRTGNGKVSLQKLKAVYAGSPQISREQHTPLSLQLYPST
ncbi:MAG: class I adenylate-forming enzyme family protein [Pseudomonadota bacterium]